MFKYVKYILVVMVLGMGLIAFNQIAKADNEVVDVGENISFRQIDPEQAKQFMDSEANYVILELNQNMKMVILRMLYLCQMKKLALIINYYKIYYLIKNK